MHATASTVKESLGIKTKRNNKLTKPNQPKWKRKIEGEIYKIRGDVSTLNEIKHEKPVKEKRKKALFSRKPIPTITEKLKQQLQAKAQRTKRFEKRKKFFYQKKTYRENAKKFYRELRKSLLRLKKHLKLMKQRASEDLGKHLGKTKELQQKR